MIYSKTVTSFICKWISCFEGIVWVNDSMISSKTQSLASFVNESAVLKESFEWMIQWFIQTQSLASFVNESAVLKNRLSEWFNDFFKNTVTCLICKWISCFEGIVWVNDSINYSKTVTCFICKLISCFEGIVWVNDSINYSKTQSLASFVNESAVLKESFEWMIQWFLQKQSLASFVNESAVLKESFEWMIQWFIQTQSLASFINESAVLKNRLSEWFNDLFKNTVTCFICKWISCFEESFKWMIQWCIQKHSHLLHL